MIPVPGKGIGLKEEEKIELNKGDLVEFRNQGVEANLEKSTTVNYPGLMSDVGEGDDLTVDNGELLMKYVELSGWSR